MFSVGVTSRYGLPTNVVIVPLPKYFFFPARFCAPHQLLKLGQDELDDLRKNYLGPDIFTAKFYQTFK